LCQRDKIPRIGVGVIVMQAGKVLLGRRKGSHGAGTWSISGGHLEFGETIEECAKRELAEETGLQAQQIELGPWTNDMIDGDKHYVTLFAFVKKFQGDLLLLEPNKCEGWIWFDWDNLPSPLFLSVQSLVKKMGIEKLKSMA